MICGSSSTTRIRAPLVVVMLGFLLLALPILGQPGFSAGSAIVTTAPFSARGPAAMVPPWASTMPLQMASPSPVPVVPFTSAPR